MKLLHALTGCLALTLTVPAFALNVSCADIDESSLMEAMDAMSVAELRTFAQDCREEAHGYGRQADATADAAGKQVFEKKHDQATDNAAVASYVAATKRN